MKPLKNFFQNNPEQFDSEKCFKSLINECEQFPESNKYNLLHTLNLAKEACTGPDQQPLLTFEEFLKIYSELQKKCSENEDEINNWHCFIRESKNLIRTQATRNALERILSKTAVSIENGDITSPLEYLVKINFWINLPIVNEKQSAENQLIRLIQDFADLIEAYPEEYELFKQFISFENKHVLRNKFWYHTLLQTLFQIGTARKRNDRQEYQKKHQLFQELIDLIYSPLIDNNKAIFLGKLSKLDLEVTLELGEVLIKYCYLKNSIGMKDHQDLEYINKTSGQNFHRMKNNEKKFKNSQEIAKEKKQNAYHIYMEITERIRYCLEMYPKKH
ncbi:hypothetical protein GF376_03095 [Candidatus Peregrinibacteria bacterium]|nr:hypothetical protein [Candidatus Peregrinibacteria bacterium]